MAQSVKKQKQSLYFPEDTLREIQKEAIRQDRSLSWIVQQAWRLARARITTTANADGSAVAMAGAREPDAAELPAGGSSAQGGEAGGPPGTPAGGTGVGSPS